MEFKELGLEEPILKALKELKIDTPTEIQEKTIPSVLQGKDVIAGSATGSGKTLAFGSGIIQNLEPGKGIQALILSPTRELVVQIGMHLKKFAKHRPMKIAVVYGGVAIMPQMKDLRTADIVVATPGRVLDHMQRQTINFSKLKILVLDEADRMLDMGFIDDVNRIISACPKKRQTLLFSATIDSDITRLARRYQNDPIKVSAVAHVDPKKLRQVYYNVQDNMKFSLLVHLLKNEKGGLVMVFCNTRRNADFVANNLKKNGIDSTAIHGGLTQSRRTKIMEHFHRKDVFVLVCTDVAARGLDIKGVSHVYNYDIPKEAKQYVHRIGRTARAGKEGIAVNVLASRDHENFSRVLREIDVKIEKKDMPRIDKVRLDLGNDRGRSGFGRRDERRQGGYQRGGHKSGGRSYNKRSHDGKRQTFDRGQERAFDDV